MSESGAALEGTRVVEVADPLGEWCGKLFADMGAEVIKVEPPGGAPSRAIGPFLRDIPHRDRSLFFWHCNTSKRSLTLDIESAGGVALLRRLIDAADVFMETLPPGKANSLALDYDNLSRTNPGLVHVALTPFGQSGPYVDARYETTDLVTMALGGPIQSCGYDLEDGDLPPVRPGQHHSFHTGSHYAFIAALAALWERQERGRGQYIDVSAQAALAVTVEFASPQWEYNRAVLRRQTGRHAGVTPTARTQFLCADGKYINLGLPRDEATWEMLLGYLRQKGVALDLEADLFRDPQRRFEMGGAVMHALEVIAASAPSEELFHLGQGLGLTWGAVRRPEDWLDDPHARARASFAEVEHPELGRSFPYPGAPYRFGASPWRIRRRAPLLGEDNAAVFAELGLTKADLAALTRAGAI